MRGKGTKQTKHHIYPSFEHFYYYSISIAYRFSACFSQKFFGLIKLIKMSLKNYIFSSINTKGAQDTDKFATIRFSSSKKGKMMTTNNGDNTTVAELNSPMANDNATSTNANVTGKYNVYNETVGNNL